MSIERRERGATQNKWARISWSGSGDQQRRVKEETGATILCFPLNQPGTTDACFYTGQQAERVALFAKAYDVIGAWATMPSF